MRYAQIRKMDISNGDGVGVSLFVQGCTHHCKGCFNPETWDFNGGKEFTEEIEDEFIELCKQPHIDFVSILGGEPFDNADEDFYWFLRRIKSEVNKPLYLWSGYTWEQIQTKDIPWDSVKDCVDYLIDGEFVEEQKDLRLKFRGSSNQRVIDVKETLKQNKIITLF